MSRAQGTLVGFIVVVVLAIVAVNSVCYTVDEREMVVVVQFGKPVATREEPGLYFKLPLVHEVRRVPKTLQFWQSDESNRLVDLPTADGVKIEVTPWFVWRISDPEAYIRVLKTRENAEQRVQNFVRGAMRDVITNYDLAEIVRSTERTMRYNEQTQTMVESGEEATDESLADQIGAPEARTSIKLGRQKMVQKILEDAQYRLSSKGSDAASSRGIELVDVGIARVDFTPRVQQAAFDRFVSFLDSVASRIRNEGEREKQEILNKTEAEVQAIEGEGQRQASVIRGDADARIIEAWAAAINKAGDFYYFDRKLQLYGKALDNKTRLILTTDNDLLSLIKTGVVERPEDAAAPAASESGDGAEADPVKTLADAEKSLSGDKEGESSKKAEDDENSSGD